MEILREEFDDRSEPDENGMYDFIYTGWYYTFRDGGRELMFCLYSDTPEIACLKRPIEWRPDVYASEFFEEAVEYLKEKAGIRTVEVCDPTPPGRGFVPLEDAVALARAAGLPVPAGHR